MREYALWIDNRQVEAASGQWQEVIDPATEQVVGRVASADAEDVNRAVAAAKAAFPAWRDLSPDARVDLLHRAAARMREAAADLAVTLTHETGRMRARNAFYVDWSARVFDFYAELARSEQGRLIPSAEPDGQLNLVVKQPYGVVACIVPWNYPILLLAWKMAPALAAGNTVVIKPASQTPLATLEMVAACFDHLPPGVVNVVTGRGSTVGSTLVDHPDVPLIAFTGSTEVGQQLMTQAVPRLKKLHLELGGKDPAIVCADADLEQTARAVAWGGFLNAGQVCTSIERVYVERPIYEEFAARLAAISGRLAVGSGFDPETQVTPMISAAARDAVHAMVSEAVQDGARLLTGGRLPAEGKGFFYPPTVVADCTHRMRLMREETFGPVLGLMPFDSLDEAIALANDSDYALGASIFTADARRVRRVIADVPAGTLWVNDPLVDNIAGPFGGMKMSGMGRELGTEGLDDFRQVKHVHWDIEARPKPWWFEG
ncbi:MAG: aldehyde dehydrogenase family protein [Anaerolineae bacterium]